MEHVLLDVLVVVVEDLVELAQHHVAPDVVVEAAVEAHLVAAVGAAEDVVAVGRVNPQRLVVAVRAAPGVWLERCTPVFI